MKKLACFLAILIIYFPLQSMDLWQSDPWTVSAPSGLKLRAHPGMESEVLAVIPHRARVEIIENDLLTKVEDEVNYLKGYWVYVAYEGNEGYVFDGFLSSLPLPEDIQEKTHFDLDLAYPLESWIGYHHILESAVDTFRSDLHTKELSQYLHGVKMEKIFTNNYYKIKVFLPKARLSEAYYLLYNMLNTKEEQSQYSRKSVFISNAKGLVDQIKINLDQPVVIQKKSEGVIITIKTFGKVCDV